MTLKVAICDDQLPLTGLLESLLFDYRSDLFEVDVYHTPFSLIKALPTTTYDLFFLDIEFPDSSGIAIAEKIRERDVSCPIVFLTSYKEYMEKVFKVNTFDYLLKPINAQKLFPVLDRICHYLDLDSQRFDFSFNKIFYHLPLKEIVYFEKNKRRVLIHTIDHDYEALLTTDQLLAKVNDHFIQIHTSFIVNSRFIKELSSHSITLLPQANSLSLPVSRKFKASAKKQILMKLREII